MILKSLNCTHKRGCKLKAIGIREGIEFTPHFFGDKVVLKFNNQRIVLPRSWYERFNVEENE